MLDFDGNSIEVVYGGGPDFRDDGTVISHSRVITWERTVTRSIREDYSRTVKSTTRAPSVASKAPSVVPQAPSVTRSHSEPVAIPQAAAPAASNSDGGTKTLIGALLGAAAGAAVAYAVVRSERDSAKKEADFNAFMEAKETVKAAVGLAQTSPLPQPPMHDPPPTYEPAPSVARSVHRNTDAESVRSSSPSRASQVPSRGQRQIEAAPASYYAPSQISLSRSRTAEPLQIEYVSASSVAGSDARSHFSSHRSMTSPEMLTIEAPRSVASVSTAKPESEAPASRAPSVAHSTAPSSFISSFVTDDNPSEGSVYSRHSSRSKAKSSYSQASSRSSRSRHTSSRSRVEDSSPSPPPPASRAPSNAPSKAPSNATSKAPSKPPSKAASVISSILGRDKKSSADSDFIDDLDIEELTEEDDFQTVVPSDSISQIGSSRRTHRRKHRSRTEELKEEFAPTVVSRSSSGSKHSESSKHSHRSHRSHKSRSHQDDDDSDHSTESRRKHRSSRPTEGSEPSEVSTVRPIKNSSKDRRKDSVTENHKYDDMFDQVQYGNGSVPVRGITPSMIGESTNNKNRSMISFAMGQKMKAFEG